MARTYIARDPRSGRRDVIVEVRPDLRDGASHDDLVRLVKRLYDRHIHIGLLITPETSYVVRDTFARLEFSFDSYDIQQISTAMLLSRLAPRHAADSEALYAQVRTWLEGVAGSWSTFLPDEALPLMLPEVVGGLAQAQFDEWDDVLDAE